MATVDPHLASETLDRDLPTWHTVVPVTVAVVMLAGLLAVGLWAVRDLLALGLWFVTGGQ